MIKHVNPTLNKLWLMLEMLHICVKRMNDKNMLWHIDSWILRFPPYIVPFYVYRSSKESYINEITRYKQKNLVNCVHKQDSIKKNI